MLGHSTLENFSSDVEWWESETGETWNSSWGSNADYDNKHRDTSEGQLTKKVVMYMKEYLNQYDNIKTVICPRTGAGHYSERPKYAASKNADVCISVHFDAGGGKGTSTLYTSGDSKSQAFAETILNSVVEATGLNKRGTNARDDLSIIQNSSSLNGMPDIVLESAFYDGDYDFVIQESNLKKIAAGAVAGILSHLGVQDKGYPDIPDYNGYSGNASSSSSGVVSAGKITTKSNEDKFMGLWKNTTGKYISYYKNPEKARYNPNGKVVKYSYYGKPIEYILNGKEYLFDLLGENENDQTYLHLMKYLLYKYTGNAYDEESKSFDFSIFDIEGLNSASSVSSVSDIPLYEPTVSREDFIKAMQEFSDSASGEMKNNFDKHFNSRSGDIYDWGVKYHINPELVVAFAYAEQTFRDPIGDESNFWGLATPNGSSSPSYGTFENGVKKMAELFQNYNAGSGTWQEDLIKQYAAERQGCNSNGYGEPGTLKGLLSIYTALLGQSDKHYDGDAGGSGGIPYLKIIYGDQFQAKCGSVHTVGVTPWTQEEYADASAYVYEQRRGYWEKIFGKYASIGSGSDIITTAQKWMKWLDDNNCGYSLGGGHVPLQDGDKSTDCTRFTSTVLGELGYIELGTVLTSYELEQNPKNWPKITNKADLQPGDILIYDNHADIYAGKGSDGSNENTCKKINAGWASWEQYASSNYIYESGWRSGYLFALRPTK